MSPLASAQANSAFVERRLPFIVNTLGSFPFNNEVEQETLPTYAPSPAVERLVALHEAHPGNLFLYFEGGEDVSPYYYGARNTYSNCNPVRDIHEVVLYHAAQSLNIPMLGVCRGHQFLAVMNGGTLYQDIGHCLGVKHGGKHLVTSHLDSVNQLLATSPFGPGIVGSWHHQAVDELPRLGSPYLYAQDGVIEGILYPNAVTIQTHPENGYMNWNMFLRWAAWMILDDNDLQLDDVLYE